MMRDQQSTRQKLDTLLEKMPLFEKVAYDVSRYLHDLAINHGIDNREVADLLHGKQIGHPLHPILTDITIGGWNFGFLFDVMSFLTGSKAMRRTADRLTILGTLSAIPTALAGLTEYSAIKKDAVKYGAAHGMLNGLAFFFYVRSSIARITGARGSAFFFALMGLGTSTASAWLGGDLVYRHRIGVNHATNSEVAMWTSAIPVDELEDETPTRVDVDESPVLLYKRDDTIYAIGAVCSHAGGPLEEGHIVDNLCVECPWHQSVFSLETGHVVHSPSTFNQPRYEVRIEDGQIEIRSWHKNPENSSINSLKEDISEALDSVKDKS